jgi:hypothetical protein
VATAQRTEPTAAASLVHDQHRDVTSKSAAVIVALADYHAYRRITAFIV